MRSKAEHIAASRARHIASLARWKQQLDGDWIDERRLPFGACTCLAFPNLNCPVDDHKIAALQDLWAREDEAA